MESLIKWSKKDYSLLRKEVNRFNRRVRELESYGREVVPEEVTYKEIKANITSRNEFNRIIKEMQRLQKRSEAEIITLESGEQITRYELGQIKRARTRAINRLQKELIEEENSLTPSNKRINEIKATLESFENLETLKGERLKRLKGRINTQGVSDYDLKKAKQFQENFIRAFRKMGRKEIVKIAKSFKNPIEFYNVIKNTNLTDIQERYDVEHGLIQLSMSKDDSYYFELEKLYLELDKLGISY